MRCSLLSLTLAAGSLGCVGAAHAQDAEPAVMPLGPKLHLDGPFNDRAIALIFDNSAEYCDPAIVGAIGNGASYVLDDINLDPGPYGPQYTGTRTINRIWSIFQTTGWSGTPNYPITNTPNAFIGQQFAFFEAGSYSTAPMLSNLTPFGVAATDLVVGSGFAWNYELDLGTNAIALGTRTNFWVAVRSIDPLTGYRMFDGNTALVRPVSQTGNTNLGFGIWTGRAAGPPCIGSSQPEYARDQNPNGLVGAPADFEGCISGTQCDPLPCTACDRRRTGGSVGINIAFFGDVQGGVPTCDSIDFNRDGIFPSTLDIEDFQNVFCGGPCTNDPLCGDIDFNNDGLFPDTLDIESLLSVFAGGPCLL